MANKFKVKKGLVVHGDGDELVFDVQGTQGQLFSITDNLEGLLFSVNDISGLPIMEVYSDDKIILGGYNMDTFTLVDNNIGIGTSTPIEKLQVNGNVKVSGVGIFESGLRAASSTKALYVSNTATLGSAVNNSKLLSEYHTYGDSNSFYNRQWLIRGSAGNDWSTVEHVDGISIDTSFETPEISRTWWRRNPNQAIHKFGNNTSTYLTLAGSYAVFSSEVTAPSFTGIGASLTQLNATNISTGTLLDARLSTNVPKLNLVNAFTVRQSIIGNDQVNSRLIIQNTGSNGRQYELISGINSVSQTGFSIFDATGNATRFTINDIGNIGIGTSTPTEKLQVNGNITAANFIGDGSQLTSINALTLGGETNVQITAKIPYSISGTSIKPITGSNTSTGTYSVVSGGYQNTASGDKSTVSSGFQNTASGGYSTVSGGYQNTANGYYSSIVGGQYNSASGTYSTVAGGQSNTASSYYSFIGGGFQNNSSGTYSVVSGGQSNTASSYSTVVAGGSYNDSSGDYSSTVGGFFNTASGYYSTVAGGRDNNASGDYTSIIGGYYNKANTYGETVGGLFATDVTGSTNTFISTDRLFSIGNGTSAGARSNALTILKNGLATLDSVTNSLIATGSTKSIITREYFEANNHQKKVNSLGSISGATSIDLSNGVYVTATLTGDITPTFDVAGRPSSGYVKDFSLAFSGVYTIIYPVGTKFAGGVAPTVIGSDYIIECSIDDSGLITVYRIIDSISI